MLSEYHRARKGMRGEVLVIEDLAREGFEVYSHTNPYDSCDLIAHKFGRFLRIQVKTNRSSEIIPGKQEVVAWVDLENKTVTYDPPLTRLNWHFPFYRSTGYGFDMDVFLDRDWCLALTITPRTEVGVEEIRRMGPQFVHMIREIGSRLELPSE